MKIDMSPEAIDARLKLTSELLNLCLSLGKAKPVAKPSQEKTDTTKPTRLNDSTNQ